MTIFEFSGMEAIVRVDDIAFRGLEPSESDHPAQTLLEQFN
jgi:hypothetical protein